jgi:hypothetical protein
VRVELAEERRGPNPHLVRRFAERSRIRVPLWLWTSEKAVNGH